LIELGEWLVSEREKKDRHHFISQFYLRPFADVEKKKGGDEYILRVLDKTNAKFYPANVSRVAYAHQFNRLENYKTYPNELEDWLAELEGELSQHFDRLITCKSLDLESTNAAINLMALFVSRRPKGREHIQYETNLVEQILYNALYHNPKLSEDREDGVTHEMIRQAIDEGQATPTTYTQDQFIETEFVLVRDLFRDLSKRTWHVINSVNLNTTFITSDSPVVLFVPGEGFSPLNFSRNLHKENGIIYFPISPDLALYGTLGGNSPPELTGRFVAELNTWMVNFADERLLFSNDGFKVIDINGEINNEKNVQNEIEKYLKSENQTKRGTTMAVSKEDIEVSRSPSELREYCADQRLLSENDDEERKKSHRRRGDGAIYQPYFTEIEPLSHFAPEFYKEHVVIKPVLGNQQYDAEVVKWGYVAERIEITKPHDGKELTDDLNLVADRGHGELSSKSPLETLKELEPILENTARKKSQKDYSTSVLVFVITYDPPYPPLNEEAEIESVLGKYVKILKKYKYRARKVVMFDINSKRIYSVKRGNLLSFLVGLVIRK